MDKTWIGKKLYNTFHKENPPKEWEHLPVEEQIKWLQITNVAEWNFPAPVYFEVHARTNDMSPKCKLMNRYADNTKESIAEVCAELQKWLESLLGR